MQAWPAFFPLPQRAGNSRSPADLAVRASVETGPQTGRRRFTHARESCPVAFVLTDDQFAAWDAFWHYTLAQGCAWFLLVLEGEAGANLTSARMSGGFQAESLSAARWRVSGTLELDDPPRLSADDYAGLVTDGRISVASEASYLHHLVHVLMPVRVPL